MPREAKDYIIHRGDKRSSPRGTSVLVGLRAIDPFLQYFLLVSKPLYAIFPSTGSGPSQSSTLASLGPSWPISTPISSPSTTILAMSVGSAIKHIYWIIFIGQEYMPVGGAVAISVFNAINNTFNTLLYTVSSANPTWSPLCVPLGAALFAAGITIETVSEIQRKNFKAKPENRGQLYAGGLFSKVRNPNYAGYTLWRAGYALAGGGWLWGTVTGAFFAWDFKTRAVPTLENYCRRKYGEKWEMVEQEVPWRLCPGLW